MPKKKRPMLRTGEYWLVRHKPGIFEFLGHAPPLYPKGRPTVTRGYFRHYGHSDVKQCIPLRELEGWAGKTIQEALDREVVARA